MRSLTITYFHTGIRTIIGVESFHGPVRDGKGWDRLAMVIRHDGLLHRHGERWSQSGRSVGKEVVLSEPQRRTLNLGATPSGGVSGPGAKAPSRYVKHTC